MEYRQNDGPLQGFNPGERLQGIVGGREGPDLGQQGLLGGGQPGERVRNLLNRGGSDLGQGAGDLEVPNEPGPAVAGRTPVIGTVRRSNGMPVARDQLSGAMG